jgi:hypothetical protein
MMGEIEKLQGWLTKDIEGIIWVDQNKNGGNGMELNR